MIINEKNQQDEEDSEGSGTQTGTGSEGFRYIDPSSLQRRDDLLPPEEIRRLLLTHKEIHETRVKKQKIDRKEREALKNGKKDLISAVYDKAAKYMGGGGAALSKYLQHPLAYLFDGKRDKEISLFPSENSDKLNEKDQNRLEQKYDLKHQKKYDNQLQYRKSPPKPSPFK